MLKKAEDFSGESLVSVDGGFTWTSYDATLSCTSFYLHLTHLLKIKLESGR